MKKINIKELKKMLELTYEESNLEFVFLSGPGIGKTSIIEQFFKEKGLTVVTITPSSMDREDWKGIKAIDFAGIENRGEKETKLISTHPGWLDADVLFIDEITNASKWEMTPIMKLISERQVGEHKFKGKIIAAGNMPENSALADILPETIRTRLIPIVLTAEPYFYRPYFLQNRMFEIADFIQKYVSANDFDVVAEDPYKGSANPRTLEKVGKILKKDYLSNELKETLIIQALGDSVGIKFINFLSQYLKQIDRETLKKINEKEFIEKMKNLPFDAKVGTYKNTILNLIEGNKETIIKSLNQIEVAAKIDIILNEIIFENLAILLNEPETIQNILKKLGNNVSATTTFKEILKKVQEVQDKIKEFVI
jgi:hypothetical protein